MYSRRANEIQTWPADVDDRWDLEEKLLYDSMVEVFPAKPPKCEEPQGRADELCKVRQEAWLEFVHLRRELLNKYTDQSIRRYRIRVWEANEVLRMMFTLWRPIAKYRKVQQ